MGAKIQFKPSKESIQELGRQSDVTNPPVSIDIDDIVAIGSKINSFVWEAGGAGGYRYYLPEKVILFLDGMQYNAVWGITDFQDDDYTNRFKFTFSNYTSLELIAAQAAKEGGPPLETNFAKFQKEYNLVDATVKAIESLPGNQGVSIVDAGVDAIFGSVQYGLDETAYGPIPSLANAPDAVKGGESESFGETPCLDELSAMAAKGFLEEASSSVVAMASSAIESGNEQEACELLVMLAGAENAS